MSREASARPPAPDCLRCRSYYVTHEAGHPHGCRAFGFQSARLPRDEVRLSSGAECAAFEPRAADIEPGRKRRA
jgi:hypothetical protein